MTTNGSTISNAVFTIVMAAAYVPIIGYMVWRDVKSRAKHRQWQMDQLKEDLQWEMRRTTQDLEWKLMREMQNHDREVQKIVREADSELEKRISALQLELSRTRQEAAELRHQLESGRRSRLRQWVARLAMPN